MAIDSIISHFNSYLALTGEEIEAVTKNVTERKIRRRQYILQEEDVCKHYNFVASGCFRMYSVDNEGKEHNIQFAIENNWIADIGSLHLKKPSKLFIEAVEPSVIFQIELEDLVGLYEFSPKFNRIFRVIIENNFIELQDRLLQAISHTAEERYMAFLDQYPNLSKRLPNTQIASFLGITPEFLSNIRKSISQK